MKRFIYLISLIFSLGIAIPIYANVDTTRITEFRYVCVGNEGILYLTYDLAGHHSYKREYKINHQGFIEVKDANYTSISRTSNLWIKGCGCPQTLTGTTRFASYSGNNIILGDRSDYGQTTTHGWDDTWVFFNVPVKRTTTVVTLYPTGNGGIPTECKSSCGNGIKDPGELCDPKDTIERKGWGKDGCDTTCKPKGPTEYCGNGIREGNESCDLGTQNGKTGSICDAECRSIGDPDPLCSSNLTGDLTHPVTTGQCSIGKVENFRDTFSGGSNSYTWNCVSSGKSVSCQARYKPAGICEDPAKSPCKLYATQTQFYTNTGGINFTLVSNHHPFNMKCSDPGKPSISCTHGNAQIMVAVPDPLPGFTGSVINHYSVGISKEASSRTGSCVITYPANSCNGERKETISIIEQDPLCLNPQTPKGCEYQLEKNILSPDTATKIWSIGMMQLPNPMYSVRIKRMTSLNTQCDNVLPQVTCTSSGRTIVAGSNDSIIPNRPFDPGYILALDDSIVRTPGICTVTYPATRCGPMKKEILTIVGGKDACFGSGVLPICTVKLETTTIFTNTGGSSKTLNFLSNYGARIIGSGSVDSYNCTNPLVPTVNCSHGTGAYTSVTSDKKNPYTLTLPRSIASSEGECTVTYPATACSPAYREVLTIREKPHTITGVVITPTQVCFNILGKSGRSIIGLPLTLEDLDLSFGNSDSQIKGVETPTYNFTNISINGAQYCITYSIQVNNTTINNITNVINNYSNITNYYTSNPIYFNSGYTLPQNLGIYPAPGTTNFKFCSNQSLQCMFTTPGGFVMNNPKRCTAKLEVLRDGEWTRDGVMYDERQKYRIVTTPLWCADIGEIKISDNPPGQAIATGGMFSGSVSPLLRETIDGHVYYTFSGEITRRSIDTLRTPRGLSVGLIYEIAGYSYYLTERTLGGAERISIVGNAMRGVRVIGNISGTASGEYNLNSRNIIQDANTLSNLRNTIVRRVSELTRGVNSGTLANGVVSYSGDQNYSQLNLNAQTIIIQGGNLVIDQDINNTTLKGIIVLSASGVGGNVIINNNVTFLKTVIYADGMLKRENQIDLNSKSNLQLVLQGALYTHNTIGGYDTKPQYIYPNITSSVTPQQAYEQDLNYVRTTPITGSKYMNYSDPFIIHYDPSVVQNPPISFR